jgi:hypothetical protein
MPDHMPPREYAGPPVLGMVLIAMLVFWTLIGALGVAMLKAPQQEQGQ